MAELKPSSQQTRGEKDTEQLGIDDFNRNTDYDDRSALHEQDGELTTKDWLIQNFIVTARVYDVLMSLLQEQEPGKAKDILELHMSGHLLGPAPRLSGMFLTDEMNEEENDSQ